MSNISSYLDVVRKTDKLPKDDTTPVLFGLYGEVGELLTIAKKKQREPNVLANSKSLLTEEFGDVFWYLSCLAIREKIHLNDILLARESSLETSWQCSNSGLLKLGKLVGDCLEEGFLQKNKKRQIASITGCLLALMKSYEIDLQAVIQKNKEKISSRFIKYEKSDLSDFDKDFPEYERLPNDFEIEFVKKTPDTIALRWNRVFIGDPLTDNSQDEDGYRFHDIFHFSYAAMLHWSPVFRKLIKQKRKSDPETDNNEDGGRAIAVEEGLSAWIFNVAKENNFFEDKENLTYDLLKHVEKAVKGLEVEQCPLYLWEETILEGYKIFRQVKDNEGGIVIGNRIERTISYKKGN